MPITRTDRWTTSDGKEHTTKALAERWENARELARWLENVNTQLATDTAKCLAAPMRDEPNKFIDLIKRDNPAYKEIDNKSLESKEGTETKEDKWIKAIQNERRYQDTVWGSIEEHSHTIAGWLLIMESELKEAKEGWVKAGDEHTLREILKVISVGCACLEQHGVFERDKEIL